MKPFFMQPLLDWSSYKDAGTGDAYADIPKSGDDFARAVAVCINSRQCESNKKGVMCPSFRVSEQAHLSTGGRVRLLKAALNGQLGEQAFNNHTLKEAMDLCVACKGCKRECENEVDMAMIKVEYLAQSYAQKLIKPSLRTRLLSNLPNYLKQYSSLSALIRLRNRSAVIAKIMELVIGLSAKRKLPVPVNKPFDPSADSTNDEAGRFHSEVVLLADTFNSRFAPQNIKSAITVLNSAGYGVHIANAAKSEENRQSSLCCGRTHIANGLLDDARQNAYQMLSALLPHVKAGRKVIGLEPACLLAIRDDYRFLGLGESAELVAQNALLFEEFIAKEVTAKRFNIDFQAITALKEPILIHGHCHQKAVGAMKSMRRVLKLIPELKFEFIESSCCGMAGSFGLEVEHSDMSMQMANLSLIPAIKQKPNSQLIANSFSCSHQILEGSQRSSMHIAQLLEQALP